MGDDGDLVRRARRGDAEAFDRLVQRHGRLVLSLARGIVRHQQDAEDVAQEAFIRLLRSLDQIDPDRPLEPWLVRLTLNVARNHVARAPSRREEELPDRPLPGRTAGPDERLRAAETRAALLAGCESLPERERLVFLLRDVQGLAVPVIADALGVTAVTVRRQSTSARRKLLEWLREHHPRLLPG